ncbi:uncharacterized protein LOC113469400 [Diaphorina citri]|uniref:Uncharacterized protein LOC113469400 n=1 Tax=Diaphorina citri TaxID=121845 RepID=A0A3Q0J828_DIACI|nr:uncharacterized protein LOC113469400 [Diaphorina citri]
MEQEFAYIRDALRDIQKDKMAAYNENQELRREVGKLQEKIKYLEQSVENAEIELDKRDCKAQKAMQENKTLEHRIAALEELNEMLNKEKTSMKGKKNIHDS